MIKGIVSKDGVIDRIKKLEGKSVEVLIDLGRNKTVTFFGELTGVYSALFTVTPFDKSFNGKTSYSYSELVCGKVKVKEI